MLLSFIFIFQSVSVAYAADDGNTTLSTGDYLYYGNFFSLVNVPDEELTEDITNAEYKNVGIKGTPDELIEVAQEGNTYYMRNQSWHGTFYYQLVPMKWRVLSVTGNKVLLLSEYATVRAGFPAIEGSRYWYQSTVRSWLNGYGGGQNAAREDYTAYNFMTFAFTEEEKSAIQTVSVKTDGSGDVDDKVFLLSEEEVKTYLPDQNDRKINIYSVNWLLRDSKDQGSSWVIDDGEIGSTSLSPENYFWAYVRPAMYLDISRVKLSPASENNTFNVTVDTESLTSTADSWAKSDIQQAVALGIIPEDLLESYQSYISREDFCRLVVSLLESIYDKPVKDTLSDRGLRANSSVFTDTLDTDVSAASVLGIVNGVGDGHFNPDGKITRAEAAVMLMRTAALIGEYEASPYAYDDASEIPSWAEESVYSAQAYGIMVGTDMNKFLPQNSFTREEAFITAFRLYNLVKKVE